MDPITLLMLAVLAVLIFFMFRNSRKRQRDAAELREKMAVGADVMTNTGIFGTIVGIDQEANTALLETTPGTVLKLHLQTITRVIQPTVDNDVTVDDPAADLPAVDGEPEFGQRLDDTDRSKPNED